jgi:hypothetical protein
MREGSIDASKDVPGDRNGPAIALECVKPNTAGVEAQCAPTSNAFQ